MQARKLVSLSLFIALLVPGLSEGKQRQGWPEQKDGVTTAEVLMIGDSETEFLSNFLRAACGDKKVARYFQVGSRIPAWGDRILPKDAPVTGNHGQIPLRPNRPGIAGAPAAIGKNGEYTGVKKLVISLGTNHHCESDAISSASKLAARVKAANPNVKCYWVGPPSFQKKGASHQGCPDESYRAFNEKLKAAVEAGGACTYVNSSQIKDPRTKSENFELKDLHPNPGEAGKWGSFVKEKIGGC